MARRSRADVKHAIDLLWAHQIRRENDFLHKQVQKVQHAQGNLIRENHAQEELHRIAQDARRCADEALAAIKPISFDLVALRVRCEQTESTVKNTFEQFEDLTLRLDVCEENWRKDTGETSGRIDKNETALRQLHEKCDEQVAKIQFKYNEISSKLESKLGQDSLEGLHLKINVLERQLAELEPRQDSLSRVEESIELPHSQENGTQSNFDHGRRGNPQCGHGEDADGEEQMLTWRNAARRESTADESFDLDRNIAVPSYAGHAYQAPPSLIDSLQPIPEDDLPVESDLAEISRLKQGRYHSWDRYLAEGQSIMDKIPREQEMLLVESFVDGLYAVGERVQCRQWLNLSGWSWNNVAAFLSSSTPSAHARVSLFRIDEQQVANQANLAGSKPAPIRGQQSVVNLARTSSLDQHHQKGPNASRAPRRSRRIAGSQNRTHASEAMPEQNQQQRGAEPGRRGRHKRNRSNSNGAPAHGRLSVPARKTLTASSIDQTPSEVRYPQESLHVVQDPAPGAHPAMLTSTRQSLRPVLPATPRRNPSSVAVAGKGSPHQTKSLKRAGLYEWARTESDGDDAPVSDGVQLPHIPSHQPERRKKRKIKSASERRAMLPPPDIPILPTSE